MKDQENTLNILEPINTNITKSCFDGCNIM